MPRGGARAGAGRKPKDGALARIHGSRQRSVVPFPVSAGQSAEPRPALPAVAPPKGLPPDVLLAWNELAPHATDAQTLTAGTLAAFVMLCRSVVLERQLFDSKDRGGADHRGMMQRVEAGMTRFRLAPMGKAMASAERPEQSKVDRFRGAKGGV